MITKSDFLLFIDAPMHLWSKSHDQQTNATPSIYEQHLMKQGYDVEKVAKVYLEKYVLPKYKNSELLWQITYISGQYQTRADGVIHELDTDIYHLYEIKSSTSTKKEHLPDATFQSIVMGDTINLKTIHLVLLNEIYVRGDDLDIEQLFSDTDITGEVAEMTSDILTKMKDALEVIKAGNSVGILNCLSPKTCPCLELCHPNLPTASIYNIPNLTTKKKRELEDAKIIDIVDIKDDYPLTSKQRKIVNVMQSKTPYLDKAKVAELLQGLIYPLYFLDYETYDEAMPLYRGHKPYQKMVFQFSLHIISSNCEVIQHEEYLSLKPGDPAKDLVKHLRKCIKDQGTVVVWNKSFEGGRNKELAELYPDYKDFLLNVNNRLFDLMEIVSKGYYLHPDFLGSWSIKNIVPVLNPMFSYKALTINKGDQAMIEWYEMVNSDGSNKNAISKALLEYCRLDSLAMVKVWEKLKILVA